MAEVLNPERPEKLSLVVFSGDFDKIHYALVMASAAAAIDTSVTLFFTMEGARALLHTGVDNVPAWAIQPTSNGLETGADMNDAFIERGVADFEVLLEACRELGVRFLVCEMGLKTLDITRGELRADIAIEVGGVVTFLNDAHKDGSIVFI